MERYSMYSKFDLKQHKIHAASFDGLEAVILPDGAIEYAMPSHIEKLISITGLHRLVVYDLMPITAVPIHWLTSFTRCISVWGNMHIGTPNTEAQKRSLELLIEEGLTR